MSDPIQPGPTVARFYVASTEEFGKPDDEGHCSGKVTLNAVSRGDQNKQWASATPSGTLTMHINNGRAFEAIRAIQRAGLDVDVVLTPVPAHTPGRRASVPAVDDAAGVVVRRRRRLR